MSHSSSSSSRSSSDIPFSIEFILSDRCGASSSSRSDTSFALPQSFPLAPHLLSPLQTSRLYSYFGASAVSNFQATLPPNSFLSSTVRRQLHVPFPLHLSPQQQQMNENTFSSLASVGRPLRSAAPLSRGLRDRLNRGLGESAISAAIGGPPDWDMKRSNTQSTPVSASLAQQPFPTTSAAQVPRKRTQRSRADARRPTFVEMIGRALLSVEPSPLPLALAAAPVASRALTLPEIYTYLESHFGERLAQESDWKGRVRNNLSINECFCRAATPAPTLRQPTGRGLRDRSPLIDPAVATYKTHSRWTINPVVLPEFVAGDFSRRLDRRSVKRPELDNTLANAIHPYSLPDSSIFNTIH